MTLADRIAVMDRGEIRQVGAPIDVYEHPNSRFVAGFIGSINMFEGEVKDGGNRVTVPALGGDVEVEGTAGSPGEKVTVALRPEKIAISSARPEAANAIEGVVKDLGYFGKDSLFRVALENGTLVSVNSVNSGRGGRVRAAEWEERVWLTFAPGAVILLRS